LRAEPWGKVRLASRAAEEETALRGTIIRMAIRDAAVTASERIERDEAPVQRQPRSNETYHNTVI